MKVKQLADLLAASIALGEGDREIKVWLPGSTVRLCGVPFRRGEIVVLEGNVDPGSALDRYPGSALDR
jgi:hypothetical protein